jgi:hypothetical protein
MTITINGSGTITGASTLTTAIASPTLTTPTISGNANMTGGTKYQVSSVTTNAIAWVNFNGTSSTPITPRANYNISSVTKNATGDYTCTFTSAVTDANYSVTGNISSLYGSRSAMGISLFTTPSPYTEVAPTTSSFRIFATDSSGTAQDFKYICLTVFGN